MDCTKGWIQATSGTSDYFHTCGYLFVPMVEAGLVPFPDGDGCSGTIYSDSWKEYIAACLTAPLLAGKKYDLRLQIASTPIAADGSSCNNGVIYYPPVEVTFFGSSSCIYAPLATFDCPTIVDPGWQVIGTGYYDPQAAWAELTLSLEPAFTVNALMIGPPCVLPPGYVSGAPCYPYFYYDNLILEELQPVDGLEILELGAPCEGNQTLIAWVNHSGGTWQWYLDGVALIGETSDVLYISQLGYGSGTYTVRYSFNGECITISEDVEVVEVEPTFIDLYACPGNTTICAGETFTDEGVYAVNLTSWQGCDSVVYCTITHYPVVTPDTAHMAVCGKDTFQVCNQLFDSTGFYSVSCLDANGCDSTFFLDLVLLQPHAVIAPPDTLNCADHPSVLLDGSLSASPPAGSVQISYAWSGPPGGIVGDPDSSRVEVGLPGTYCLVVTLSSGNQSCSDSTCITVVEDTQLPLAPVIAWPALVCAGDTLILPLPKLPNDSSYQILWDLPFGITVTELSDSTILFSAGLPGIWGMCAALQTPCGISDTVCQVVMVAGPDSLDLWNTTCDLASAGTTVQQLQNVWGCDSVIVHHLQFEPAVVTLLGLTTCDPATVGTDTVWLTAQSGCDSIVILQYTLTSSFLDETVTRICGEGLDFTDSLLILTGPCDSLWITHYQYAAPDTIYASMPTCVQAEVGTDTTWLINQEGCDSLIIRSTWFGGSDTVLVSEQTCDSLSAGVNTVVFPGQYCDSVVVTTTTWSAKLITVDTLLDCTGTGTSVDTAWLTSITGCDSLHIQYTIHSSLSADISVTPETCFQDEDGAIQIMQPQGGTPPYLFRINGGVWQNDPHFPDLGPGDYVVGMMDAAGCLQQYAGLVVEAGQQVLVNIGPDQVVAPGAFLDLSAQVNQALSLIQWMAVDPVSCLACLQTLVGPIQVSQQVSVEVVSDAGCTGSDELRVIVVGKPVDSIRVYIPNSFSPNGDGINDVFSVYGNDHVLQVRNLAVYDRWGNALYARSDLKINDPSKGWDGTFREEVMDPGVYVYVVEVELVNGEVRLYKGDVTLTR
ncbi:MAG: gliding motility-associated C-terminal domain-containing protein [Saprospiraceae bacterium]|nr:gliding motility-associated C-terminal domain-containing protein [Saprospiraceae bacterium]